MAITFSYRPLRSQSGPAIPVTQQAPCREWSATVESWGFAV